MMQSYHLISHHDVAVSSSHRFTSIFGSQWNSSIHHHPHIHHKLPTSPPPQPSQHQQQSSFSVHVEPASARTDSGASSENEEEMEKKQYDEMMRIKKTLLEGKRTVHDPDHVIMTPLSAHATHTRGKKASKAVHVTPMIENISDTDTLFADGDHESSPSPSNVSSRRTSLTIPNSRRSSMVSSSPQSRRTSMISLSPVYSRTSSTASCIIPSTTFLLPTPLIQYTRRICYMLYVTWTCMSGEIHEGPVWGERLCYQLYHTWYHWFIPDVVQTYTQGRLL